MFAALKANGALAWSALSSIFTALRVTVSESEPCPAVTGDDLDMRAVVEKKREASRRRAAIVAGPAVVGARASDGEVRCCDVGVESDLVRLVEPSGGWAGPWLLLVLDGLQGRRAEDGPVSATSSRDTSQRGRSS